jgi:toxin FitB
VSHLLDTCALSDGGKINCDHGLANWLVTTPIEAQFVSVLSLAEIEFGILRMPVGRKRERLEEWCTTTLRQTFAGRILAFEEPDARIWAALRAAEPNRKFLDSQLAATALTHGLTVVTRNVRDFAFAGLPVFNPWSK